MKTWALLTVAAAGSSASYVPSELLKEVRSYFASTNQQPLQFCEHSALSRDCWGNYNTETNYYEEFPDTGKTVEVWLSAQEGTCNQDGYERPCMTFNGTIPGPTITAEWGDELVIHVTNNMRLNGTSVHWHGLRQWGSVEYDGVPGVTQCPIRPSDTLTYRFKITQYGSTWYHSHFSLQYSDGLYGALILKGPSTANYDEDAGPIFLSDWPHTPIFSAWANKEKYGIIQSISNLLINGTNTFDCSGSSDPACVGDGKKFETVFKKGKKYLLRLVNVATDSQFQFSIDGHNLTVIANDLVPIEPFETDSIIINSAQRYDVVVEANAEPGDYWIRGGWVNACFGVANDHPKDMTGIVRYDPESTQLPKSLSNVVSPTSCLDEAQEHLVPRLKLDVGNIAGITAEELKIRFTHTAVFQWTINSSSLVLDWNKPTLQRVFNNESIFPTSYNVVPIEKKSPVKDEWAVLVIENKVVGILGGITHPIHVHGHDFWVVAQESEPWDGTTDSFNLYNPPRRDTAGLPARGYLAIAFQLNNPGVWLVHCHIQWHASQGLSLEFVESEEGISAHSAEDREIFDNTCKRWNDWYSTAPFSQDDSGI